MRNAVETDDQDLVLSNSSAGAAKITGGSRDLIDNEED